MLLSDSRGNNDDEGLCMNDTNFLWEDMDPDIPIERMEMYELKMHIIFNLPRVRFKYH
jgi:hypothetical protein